MTDPSSSSPPIKKRLLVTFRGSIDGAMARARRATRQSLNLNAGQALRDEISASSSDNDESQDEDVPVSSQTRSSSAIDKGRLIKGKDYFIYDSDDENGGHRHMTTKESHRPWDPQEVRKSVRPELVYPGKKWDDKDLRKSFFPHVSSAEIRLHSSAQQNHMNSATVVRAMFRYGKRDPLHVSTYLAAEAVAQIVKSGKADPLWDMAEDMEEYIRRAIWPRSMQRDAKRIQDGLPSDVVALAKAIPRAYTAGFNNDSFWGQAVYLALRFPPGLHPFKTPVVRDMIGRLRTFIEQQEDMWTTASDESTTINLAAAWAGYHVARHLITRNEYHLSPYDVETQHDDLDSLVQLVARECPQIKALFEGTIAAPVSEPLAKLETWVFSSRWDRFAAHCHVVDFEQPSALPPPLRKPSIILKQMQVEQPLPHDRPWDNSKPFTTKYDAPLPLGTQCRHADRITLPVNLSKSITKINEELADFLKGHVEEPETEEAQLMEACPEEAMLDEPERHLQNPVPAEATNSTGVLQQIEAVRHRCEDLGLDVASVKQCIDEVKEQILSSQAGNKETMESILATFEERLLEKVQSMVQTTLNDIKGDVTTFISHLAGALSTNIRRTMACVQLDMAQHTRDMSQEMIRDVKTSMAGIRDEMTKHVNDMKKDKGHGTSSTLEQAHGMFMPIRPNNAAHNAAHNAFNDKTCPPQAEGMFRPIRPNNAAHNTFNNTACPPQASAVNPAAMLHSAQQWQAQQMQANPWLNPMHPSTVNPGNLNFNSNPPASQLQIPRPQGMVAPINHIDRPARRPASMDATGHIDRKPRFNTDKANDRRPPGGP